MYFIYFTMLYLHFCFVFNDTATTEIYTYLHTLSLHDALPISGSASRSRRRTAPSAAPRNPTRPDARRSPRRARGRCRAAARCRYGCTASRSEEHTSELQSLMRISSAVFCLKKKKKYLKCKHIKVSAIDN